MRDTKEDIVQKVISAEIFAKERYHG